MKRVCHIIGTFALLTLVAGPIAAQEAVKEGAEKTKDAVVKGTDAVVHGTKVAATRAYGLTGVPDNELNWTDPEVDAGSRVITSTHFAMRPPVSLL